MAISHNNLIGLVVAWTGSLENLLAQTDFEKKKLLANAYKLYHVNKNYYIQY